MNKKILLIMGTVNRSNYLYPSYYLDSLKKGLTYLERKISQLVKGMFIKENKSSFFPRIVHLGGIRLASFDPQNQYRRLRRTCLFYERIPISGIKGKEGQVFFYGRTLKSYFKEWARKQKEDPTTPSFQDFMAKKINHDPKLWKELKKKIVRYFSEEERKRTKVQIIKGKLCQIGIDQPNQGLRPLPPGQYAFVIGNVFDEKGKKFKEVLCAAVKTRTKKGRIQHSSFFRGGNVVAAAMWKVHRKGKVTLRQQSGHYCPTIKEIALALHYLKNHGYDLTQLKLKLTDPSSSHRADQWFEQVGQYLLK